MYLHEFTVPTAVSQYSCAINPGKHCPLFGVSAALRMVSGITLIYIGTQDCVYYAQKDTLIRQLQRGRTGQDRFRTLAVQLTDSDLIFGIRPQLEKLLEQEARREETSAIYLVTSCSLEVLSEDLESVVAAVAKRCGKKILRIPTENFKTFSYLKGIEDGMAALAKGIPQRERKERSFAVLGARQPGAEYCEPVQWLRDQGCTLHSILPFDTDAQRLQTLSEVGFTLVVDGTGLELAKQLEEDYKIPYVRFDEKLELDAVVRAWRQLCALVGEDREVWIAQQLEEIRQQKEEVRKKVEGSTFFYGHKVIYPFESCLFLADLGMEPTCIFLGSVMDKKDEPRLELSRRFDPQVWQGSNLSSVKGMLAQYEPQYFVGADTPMMAQYGLTCICFEMAPVEVGFAFYRYGLELVRDAAERRASR